jgi:preprotein translocase subunit YajC
MTSQQLAGLIPLLVFFVLMYLLFWRPQMVQMRRRREMLAALRPGDRVVTIGGLHATILEVKDDVLVLELAPNVRVRADRTAVQAVRGRVAAMPERAAGGRR